MIPETFGDRQLLPGCPGGSGGWSRDPWRPRQAGRFPAKLGNFFWDRQERLAKRGLWARWALWVRCTQNRVTIFSLGLEGGARATLRGRGTLRICNSSSFASLKRRHE